MADSLTLLRKSMNMLQHMRPDDLVLIKRACQDKLHSVKGPRSIKTLNDAMSEIDKLLAA